MELAKMLLLPLDRDCNTHAVKRLWKDPRKYRRGRRTTSAITLRGVGLKLIAFRPAPVVDPRALLRIRLLNPVVLMQVSRCSRSATSFSPTICKRCRISVGSVIPCEVVTKNCRKAITLA